MKIISLQADSDGGWPWSKEFTLTKKMLDGIGMVPEEIKVGHPVCFEISGSITSISTDSAVVKIDTLSMDDDDNPDESYADGFQKAAKAMTPKKSGCK